jgi:hypothetical protein
MNPVREAQILSHLILTGKRLGFLINFNVSLIKNGIKRIYYNLGVFVSLWLNYYVLIYSYHRHGQGDDKGGR